MARLSIPEPQGNRVLIGRIVAGRRRETGKTQWRPELTAVEKLGDEIGLGVKRQSN